MGTQSLLKVPSFLATAPSMFLERGWDQDATLSADTMVVTYQSLDTTLTHQIAQLKSRGVMGKAFPLFKLRTMRSTAPGSPTPWTTRRDSRATAVGSWLRRTRLDELPQLLNVLKGEMSLIGPRPEQPNLDFQLEETNPHDAKRDWMLPGLSGWAQVCGPAYPASLEEAELKLSYNLHY